MLTIIPPHCKIKFIVLVTTEEIARNSRELNLQSKPTYLLAYYCHSRWSVVPLFFTQFIPKTRLFKKLVLFLQACYNPHLSTCDQFFDGFHYKSAFFSKLFSLGWLLLVPSEF